MAIGLHAGLRSLVPQRLSLYFGAGFRRSVKKPAAELGVCNKPQKFPACNDRAQLTGEFPRLHDSRNRANRQKTKVLWGFAGRRGGASVAWGPGAEYGCGVVDYSTATNPCSGWAE